MDNVTSDLFRGQRTFIDYPLRSFYRYGPDGNLCDDTFYSDMDIIFRSLATAVVADIKEPVPNQRKTEAIIAAPFCPDAEWFLKFINKLKFPIVYFKNQVPLDARMKFTIFEPGAPPTPGDVPISAYCPYAMGLLYVGESHPWTEKLPKDTTSNIAQCFLFDGLRAEYMKQEGVSPSPPPSSNPTSSRTPARPTKEDIEQAQATPRRNYMDEQD